MLSTRRRDLLVAVGALFLSPMIVQPASSYADEAPDRLVMRVTDEVMKVVRTNKQLRNGDLVVAASVTETLIARHFDFPRLTAGVLPSAWLSASPSQQERLTREFRTMLIQTLAVTLSSLTDERIVLDGSTVSPDGKAVIVRCKVLSPGDEAVSLEYEFAKTGNDWKAHEMKIGGVSLIATYRRQFAQVVRTQGVNGLISVLEKKNAAAVRVSEAAAEAKAPPVPQPPTVPVASPPVPTGVLPAHIETSRPNPVAAAPVAPSTTGQDRDGRAKNRAKVDIPRRVAPPRRQDETNLLTTTKGPCVYKPVMTDEDIANCR
jgi:phospholipid transport system substrate-binding protein